MMGSRLSRKETKHKVTKEDLTGASAFGAANYALEEGANYAESTREAFNGMELLRKKAEQIINVGDGQKQGNLFEFIEATKFNMDAALKSSDIRAFVTDAEGRPHAPADVEIRLGDEVLREAQLKSYRSAQESLFAQSNSKYADMQRVSPSDQFDKMQELANKRIETGTLKADDYQNTVDNMERGLRHKDIGSPGTERSEAEYAAKDHERYIAEFKTKTTIEETYHNMANAAVAGGAISGAISITRNIVAVKTGEIEVDQAVMNVAKETAAGAARSTLVAGTATIIKNTALDHGLGAIAKGNVATATAVAVINVSKSVIKYAKGDITLEEMTIEIGQSGAQSISGLYFGIVGAAVGGPVGAMVGSMAGYLIANISYQTVVDIIKSSKLEMEQYERLKPIYEESIYQMKRMEEEFNQIMAEYFRESNKYIRNCFKLIDSAVENQDTDAMARGLVNLVSVFGKRLEVMSYEEFKDFMVDDSVKLHL